MPGNPRDFSPQPKPDQFTVPYRLSLGSAAAMVVQASLGLLFPSQYRDTQWVAATWYGNDWFTLLIVAPILGASMWYGRRGSMSAMLLWLGVLAYSVYNYAFYLVGAALNAFFPLYVIALVLSAAALITGLIRTDPARLGGRTGRLGDRILAGFFLFLAAGLSVVWLGLWAAHVFAGRPLPAEPGVFHVVAAVDLTLMVPILAVGAVWLWHGSGWGHVIAPVAGTQAGLYLTLLTVNTFVVASRGLGGYQELPIWGGLAFSTLVATSWQIVRTRRRDASA